MQCKDSGLCNDCGGNFGRTYAGSGASAYGGFIFNIYKDLSGFGQFRGPHSYGFKDAVLGTDVVKNAPYMSSAGILHEDK